MWTITPSDALINTWEQSKNVIVHVGFLKNNLNWQVGIKYREHQPVVIRFEGAVLVEAHVLGLLVRQLSQVGVKVWQVQTGHILIWKKDTDLQPKLSGLTFDLM